MIRHLKIERFKSLVKLELELGRVNVFVGANGSGKSNLLEGLGVLGAAAFGRVDDETLLRRGVRPGVPTLYRTAFSLGKKVQDIGIEAVDKSGALFKVTLWNADKNQGAPWNFKTEKLAKSGLKEDVIASRSPNNKKEKLNSEQGLAAWATVKLQPGDPALELMELLRNYSIYCPNTPSLRGLVQDLQAREPVGLAGGRLPEAIEELLNPDKKNAVLTEALEEARDLLDWASDFSAKPSSGVPLSPSAARSRLVIQFVDRFMAQNRNELTGYDASEGALYILYYAALALHPKSPRCLAVDNLDQALNPRLAQKLMTALCSWTTHQNGGRQWLITAHNPAILDGLPLTDPEVRLFTVDRDSNGHTVVRRIDLDAAISARPNEEWTLSRMWMNGLLGGVPNV
jgi:predicted ATPase